MAPVCANSYLVQSLEYDTREVVLQGDRVYLCFSKHGFLPQYIILIPFNASHDKHVHVLYACTPMNVDNYASSLRYRGVVLTTHPLLAPRSRE
jgi:hypothetical protein